MFLVGTLNSKENGDIGSIYCEIRILTKNMGICINNFKKSDARKRTVVP